MRHYVIMPFDILSYSEQGHVTTFDVTPHLLLKPYPTIRIVYRSRAALRHFVTSTPNTATN